MFTNSIYKPVNWLSDTETKKNPRKSGLFVDFNMAFHLRMLQRDETNGSINFVFSFGICMSLCVCQAKNAPTIKSFAIEIIAISNPYAQQHQSARKWNQTVKINVENSINERFSTWIQFKNGWHCCMCYCCGWTLNMDKFPPKKSIEMRIIPYLIIVSTTKFQREKKLTINNRGKKVYESIWIMPLYQYPSPASWRRAKKVFKSTNNFN